MPSYPPTPEQQAAIEAFATGDDLVIQAGAGTGKTSTLRMLAETTPRRRGLYIAFNRAIAGDAKRTFPRNVEAATAHSLAFRAVGHQYRDRLDGPRVPARLAAQHLNITGPTRLGDDVPILAPQQIARIVMGTIARFARSADPEPLAAHVPHTTKFDSPAQRRALAAQILPLARRAWEDLTATRGRLKFTHDCQPAGTLVSVVKGGHNTHQPTRIEQVPIEAIREGDKVVSWGGTRLGYVRRSGRRVAKIGSRNHDGDLITIKTPTGHQSAYTPEHICIAVIGDSLDGKTVVYLMRRGSDFRIGRTPWRYGSQGNTLGIITRARHQGAEAVWILSAHDTDRDAALAEALAQHEYNIPGWQFRSANEFMPLDQFWAKAGNNIHRAVTCLKVHGRDLRFPLWEEGQQRQWCRVPIQVRACNLMDGMRVCVVDQIEPGLRGQLVSGGWTDAWQPITLARSPYSGPVYFLDVETDHTYVADGIVTHNCYLKLWQLSYPVLPCEFVLFDEAQDADPVIMSIIGNQPNAQRIVVGDSAQAIYEWRGAIDALAKFTGKRLTLSKSFRFGPAVANEANRWLDELDAPLRLEGHEPIPSRIVDDLGEPDAILCRSNAGAMTQVMTALAQGRRVALVGGGKDIRDLAAAAVALKAGAPCEHPELFAFHTWGEVQDYVAMDEGGSDLRAMVKLIDDYGPDSLIAAVDRLVDEPATTGSKPMALTTTRPDVIVSTAHKAKGREWASVLIGEDFYPPRNDDDGTPGDPEPGELRLAYVGVTRARLVLDRGSLRWLDAYRLRMPIPGPDSHAERRSPVAASPAPQNASSTTQPPARPLPAGIYCGPGGRMTPEDLDDLTKAEVQTFADYLRQRKELGDHYSQLLAAATPGTRDYTRIADERATKLRQLAADYERNADQLAKELA